MNLILLILSVIPLICNAQVPSQVTVNGQCPGSVINERWIVTSASCSLLNAPTTAVVSTGGLNYPVERVITHPNYIQNQPDNDIALMRLNTNLANNGIVMDFNEAHDYRGLTVILNGWPFANQQTFQVVDESYCSGYVSNTRNFICAIPQTGQQFNCHVNTGSPMIYNNNLLIGLQIGTNQCGNQAHVFTRISRHSAWISNQIAFYGNLPYSG